MKECVYRCDMCGVVLSDNFGEKHLTYGDVTVISKAYKRNQPADLCYSCWEKVMDKEGSTNGKA